MSAAGGLGMSPSFESPPGLGDKGVDKDYTSNLSICT